jgi:thiol-disulfide isomerase/thioredoxin
VEINYTMVAVAIVITLVIVVLSLGVSGVRRKVGFVLHYAEWCPACQRFKPEWEALKKEHPGVAMTENDEARYPHREVRVVPAISYVEENRLTGAKSVKYYSGEVTREKVKKFIEK